MAVPNVMAAGAAPVEKIPAMNADGTVVCVAPEASPGYAKLIIEVPAAVKAATPAVAVWNEAVPNPPDDIAPNVAEAVIMVRASAFILSQAEYVEDADDANVADASTFVIKSELTLVTAEIEPVALRNEPVDNPPVEKADSDAEVPIPPGGPYSETVHVLEPCAKFNRFPTTYSPPVTNDEANEKPTMFGPVQPPCNCVYDDPATVTVPVAQTQADDVETTEASEVELAKEYRTND